MGAVSWSKVGTDLLTDIITRLSPTDQIRFQTVCKYWQSIRPIRDTNRREILSLFVCINRYSFKPTNKLEFGLYEPLISTVKPLSTHTIFLSTLGIPVPSSHTRIKIFSKSSCLFMSIRTRNLYFLLYFPFTKKLKLLPPLACSSLQNFEQSFSTDPDRADCTYLLLDTYTYIDTITLATLSSRDKEWTVRRITKNPMFKQFACVPIYIGGIFYIVSAVGQLATYNATNKIFKFESLVVDDDFVKNQEHGWYRVFRTNGELMYSFGYKSNVCMKKFDWPGKVWIPVKSLPCHASPRANMREYFDSGCVVSSAKSMDLYHDMYNSLELKFNSGSTNCNRANTFFWLEPPLIQ